MIADDMDLPSLLAWRACCRSLYGEASASLQRTLTHVLRRFLQHPNALLEKLTDFRAIIGGTSALAFLLRDLSVRSDILQIYVPVAFYRPMLDRLTTCAGIASEIHSVRPPSRRRTSGWPNSVKTQRA